MSSHHQINNIWDAITVGFVWVIGLSYKLIAAGIVWFVGLFHIKLSLDISEFNEWLHTVVLLLAGILTAIKLYPIAKKWYDKKDRKFSKKSRK
jgi:hypothetical protein